MLQPQPPNWPAAVAFALLGTALAVGLRAHLRGRAVWRYDTRAAWLRAVMAFSYMWSLAAAAGTLSTLRGNPLVFPGQASDPAWLAATAACVLVVAVGYFVIWPIDTRAHGRRVVVPDTLVFGIVWGVSEGLLYATVWLLAHRALGGVWAGGLWTVLVVVTAMSVFSGLWHSLWWDVHVAPEHNVIDGNLRKVLLVHTPNLVLCTTYVTLYENLGIYVLLEALALFGSAVSMPFPTFRRPHPVDPDGPSLGPPTDEPSDMTGRTAVVTGGAGAAGAAVVRDLVARGARVVIVDIDADRAEALCRSVVGSPDGADSRDGAGSPDGADSRDGAEVRDGAEARVVVGDLSTGSGVREVAGALAAACPRIDVLVNAAEVRSPTTAAGDAGGEQHLAVNHLAAFLLTRLLWGRLVESGARVVTRSSEAHRQARGPDLDDLVSTGAGKGRPAGASAGASAYRRSMLAVTMATMELAERARGSGVTVNAATPGSLSWVATSPELDGVTGWYWHRNRPLEVSRAAQDRTARVRLWTWSEQACGPDPVGGRLRGPAREPDGDS
jgi:NAD(P)-dependent dehydrogenase (short-subunit alcohol dehydrogenase family)